MDGSLLEISDPPNLCFDDQFVECENVPLGSTCFTHPDSTGNDTGKSFHRMHQFTVLLFYSLSLEFCPDHPDFKRVGPTEGYLTNSTLNYNQEESKSWCEATYPLSYLPMAKDTEQRDNIAAAVTLLSLAGT